MSLTVIDPTRAASSLLPATARGPVLSSSSAALKGQGLSGAHDRSGRQRRADGSRDSSGNRNTGRSIAGATGRFALAAIGAAAGALALRGAWRLATGAGTLPAGMQPLPRASVAETLGFLTDVALPVIARGVLQRRPAVMAMAEALDLDRRAVQRMQGLRDRHAGGPLMLRLPLRRQAVLLRPEEVRRVLEATPEPFATDSPEKRAALAHFQPRGVLISPPAQRPRRREINAIALDAGHPMHRMAASLLPVVQQEAQALLAAAGRSGILAWRDFARSWATMVRRVVLGAGAGGDEELSGMLSQLRADANWAFLKPRRDRLRQRFMDRLGSHLARAEPGSLAAHMATHGLVGDEALQQVPQWLFAFDAGGMVSFRAQALLTSHPGFGAVARQEAQNAAGELTPQLPFLRAALLESARLWSTTPVILRESISDTSWGTRAMPAGTGILIYAPFFHRDDTRLTYANRFTPQLWLGSRSRENGALVPFSDGPAVCAGRELVLMLGSAFLAEIARSCRLQAAGGARLDPRRPLPGTLNHFALKFAVKPAATGAAS